MIFTEDLCFVLHVGASGNLASFPNIASWGSSIMGMASLEYVSRESLVGVRNDVRRPT